jgi:hypothetical protein
MELVISLIKRALANGCSLHVFSPSTAKEMDLFTNKIPLEKSKLLLRFVFIIYGLLMTTMPLKGI